MITHPIPPFYDEHSKILILGSFPSVKSREQGFFYGHPQNRFWRVLSSVFEEEVPLTIPQKKEFLKRNRIALWDVLASCEITGSADSSITNAVPNDISCILQNSAVIKIFVNGGAAEKYFNQYMRKTYNIQAQRLPSTSPANAAWSLERLIEAWRVVRSLGYKNRL
ncbi:MAG: DNA-deoxyinosine glycosylase [Ruminococcaceae bacterium]|nr:DNA-deoxyinosine glycosylase [Oscillospiraceae bacterium]